MKVVSGGQTGVDQAALDAALALGLQTGGEMPAKFMTLQGQRPDMAETYGMTENASPSYDVRTFANVSAADATIRFARYFSSAGERCTLRAIHKYKKPYFDINASREGAFPNPEHIAKWLYDQNVQVLNVAGNSHTTAIGIYDEAYAYFVKVFALWKDHVNTNQRRACGQAV